MAKASRKAGSVIAVICGCLGAGWLFYYGLEEFVNNRFEINKVFKVTNGVVEEK